MTSLQPMSVRHHLRYLVEVGLVEEVSREKKKSAGRPGVYYRATGKTVEVSLPRRHYMYLSEALLTELVSFFDEEKVMEFLLTTGIKLGRKFAKDVQSHYDIKEWSPEVFKNTFIPELSRLGIVSEVVELNPHEVVFIEYNCPFQELALKYPKLVCDRLDMGFHLGIDEVLGKNVKTEKLKCMGHGDSYCEYAVRWEVNPFLYEDKMARKNRRAVQEDLKN